MRKTLVSAVIAIGMITTAAPALAAYPVPFTPVETIVQAGQNNGFTVANPANTIPAAAAKPVAQVKPAAKPRAVLVATVDPKQPVAPRLTGLPKNADVVIRLIVNGKYLILGSATTTAKGTLQLPVVRFAKAGTYFFQVTFDNGNSVRLKVVVD